MDAPLTLPPGARVGAVTLQVSDLSRSLHFYQDVLGFTVAREERVSGGASATLAAPGGNDDLVHLREKSRARRVPPRGRLGLYHFAILLPTRGDLGRFFRHVTDKGVQVGAADHLFSEALYLTDPDGITIEVYRDRPSGEWIYQQGELVAATDPLDVDGIVEAAGSTRWKNLPAGTTIGHVHFYVGNLARAEEFYVTGLGFEKRIESFPGALFVSAGGYHHHVGLNTWAADAPLATDDDARLLWWDLLVPGPTAIREVVSRLARLGYEVGEAPTPVARDAWGIAVRLVEAL